MTDQKDPVNPLSKTSVTPDIRTVGVGGFRPSRRAVLGAGLGGAAALVASPWAAAPAAHADPAKVWSVQTVAIIGADAILGCGVAALRSDVVSLGFLGANVFIDAVAGRTLGVRDSSGRTTEDVLAGAIEYFGGDPDVWVVDLGATGTDTEIQGKVTAALTAMGNSTDRKICWMNQTQMSSLGSTDAARFNGIAGPLVNARPSSWFQDLQNYLVGHLTEGPFSATSSLTSTGYALMRRFIRYAVLPATVGADGGWTKARLLATPARPGSSIQDPRSGYVWATVRYEDLYQRATPSSRR